MKKVTAFVGTASRKATYHAVRQFLDDLQAHGDVDVEIVRLSDYRLEVCRGCKQCFIKGEEHCPLEDDRDVLLKKMMASDGVVFATPNYSFQVSAQLKLLLDRLGFVFHRPRYFGKTFTSIVAQGFYGGRKIERYLDFVGDNLGFCTVRGTCFTALEPMKSKEKQKLDRALAKQSAKFYERLTNPVSPVPSLFKLLGFRMGQAAVRLECSKTDRDYTYYRERGWLDSEYFYPARFGLLKRVWGRLLARLAASKYGEKRGQPVNAASGAQ